MQNKTVRELDSEEYTLIQSDIEVRMMLEFYAKEEIGTYTHLIAKIKNGEVLELYGIEGIPYLSAIAWRLV